MIIKGVNPRNEAEFGAKRRRKAFYMSKTQINTRNYIYLMRKGETDLRELSTFGSEFFKNVNILF